MINFSLRGNVKKYINTIFFLLCLAAIIWGLRVLFYEGIYYSIPRHFNGDFYAATFGDLQIPDRIFYGPLYSLLWGLTNYFSFITIYHFAIASILLYFLGLYFCLKFANLPKVVSLFCIALSLCFYPVILSISIAAFPEIFEFFCISLAIYFALGRRHCGEIICISFAAFMKFIPWFLIVPILLGKRWGDLIISAILFSILVTIVSFVNNFSLIQTIVESAFPLGGTMGYIGPLSPSGEFTGLPEFFLRFTTSIMGDESRLIYLNSSYGLLSILISAVIISICLFAATTFTFFLKWNERREFSFTLVKESYLLWVCLLPILTLRSHSHTFILLVPSFFLIASIIVYEYPKLRAKLITSFSLNAIIVVFLVSYVWIGFRPGRYFVSNFLKENSLFVYLWKEEIIIGNLLLFFNSLLLIILVHVARYIQNAEAPINVGSQ